MCRSQPQYTLLSWVGYDDNREMNMTSDTRIPKVIFQTMANFLQKKNYGISTHNQSQKNTYQSYHW